MAQKLDFQILDEEVDNTPKNANRRWKSREPNHVVQMSLRMPEETYDRFRSLCMRERRTNGDMLRVLMEGYFDRSKGEDK